MIKNKEQWLIVICWVSYVIASLGRYGYNSNVTLVMDRFAVEHAEASLPATLFFFAYGLGQICVGVFCHKFNRKLLVVSALGISGVINLAIFFGTPFVMIKYLWFLNGFAQANLWPALMLILRENVSVERLDIVGVVMAMASTGGKFLAIGLCAILAINTELFMYCFLIAGILTVSVALAFFFATGKIKKPEHIVRQIKDWENPKQKSDKKAIILLLLLGLFSFTCYAISGGLQSWVPAIVKEKYGMSDALSIFMSILLPLFTLSASVISLFLYKKLKNYVLISLFSFLLGAVLIAGVLLFIDIHWLPVIILFTMESVTMGIIANTTTVQVPLTFKGQFNAGFLAGFLNGACYIGMAIATYVLGFVADASGWTSAFILLIVIALSSTLFAFVYLIFQRKNKCDNKEI